MFIGRRRSSSEWKRTAKAWSGNSVRCLRKATQIVVGSENRHFADALGTTGIYIAHGDSAIGFAGWAAVWDSARAELNQRASVSQRGVCDSLTHLNLAIWAGRPS
jgi:hypothetical protein